MNAQQLKTINIAKDFSTTPGARYRTDGPFSGEEFRQDFLEPLFESLDKNTRIRLLLDGTEGYATSFLEEAFGGLARIYGKTLCLEILKFISNDDPLLVDEISDYIEHSDDK